MQGEVGVGLEKICNKKKFASKNYYIIYKIQNCILKI